MPTHLAFVVSFAVDTALVALAATGERIAVELGAKTR